MYNKRKSSAKQFSKIGQADYWNNLYHNPNNVFEYHMLLRRDYTYEYIQANIPKTADIIDLGCGAGVLMENLLHSEYKVIGIDVSSDMLELTGKRLEIFPHDNYTLIQADCTKIPLKDNQYDLIVCLGMFGYFNETDKALQEIRRILRPGGILILSIRNRIHQIIFDPFAFILKTGKRKISKTGNKQAGKAGKSKPDSGNESTSMQKNGTAGNFIIRVYEWPSKLIAGVKHNGYKLLGFFGLGYGPFTVCGHNIFPTKFSIRLSRIAERFVSAMGIGDYMSKIADVSIYIFKKK